MTPRLLTAGSALAVLLASASAQSFSYPDFSNTTTLSLLGNAAQSGTALRLTANGSNQSGWSWHQTAMPIIAGFDTTFTFRITPPAFGTKAEGMAFVIHDDPSGTGTMGGTVWGIGYGNGANSSPGIRNSIAIELDTFQDGFLGDTSANELTVHTRGPAGNNEQEQWSIGRNTPSTNLSNGQVHTLRILYVPGTLSVFVDNAVLPALQVPYDFTTGGQYLNNSNAPGANLQSGTAWLGFCATTGAGTLTELVEILSWDWMSTPLADPCYAGSLGEDVLEIDGSAGGPLREITVATHQPFTIGMAAPTGMTGPAGYILLMTPVPQPGAFGTVLPFGNACMPMLPIGPLVFVTADSFGWLGGGLPAGPAPTSIQIPTGLVSFPIDVTLQAVIETSTNPFALGLSNAIDLHIEVSPSPVITVVSPLSATPGTAIVVSGTSFVPGLTLTVNGNAVATTSVTATNVTFPYPTALPCSSQLIVRNPDGQQATSAFNPTPTVTSTVLGSGPASGGAIFIVQGTGFSPGTAVTVGGNPGIVLSAGATTVTIRTPAGSPGQAVVILTTLGGCSATTTYTYL